MTGQSATKTPFTPALVSGSSAKTVAVADLVPGQPTAPGATAAEGQAWQSSAALGGENAGPIALLIRELLASSIILAEDWDNLSPAARTRLLAAPSRAAVLGLLVEEGLLTGYQAARVDGGTTFGLVLGNYRVLDRLGTGGMAVVFRAEHIDMRRPVAIKVFRVEPGGDPERVSRFLAEVRAVARLNHPNVVAAVDAGKVVGQPPDATLLRYFVMEYVQGEDLERKVAAGGPLLPGRACDIGYQLASALAEVHKYNLVHRDIKPSNVLLTAEGQAKLLDFGLARHFDQKLTVPGVLLGTLDYVAPEQARDASAADIRSDIYALGGTLFWCLTGEPPFRPCVDAAQEPLRRLSLRAPSPRSVRPGVPAEIDAVVTRMLSPDPADRYPTPEALMRALMPFCKPETREHTLLSCSRTPPRDDADVPRALIVDDHAAVRAFCRQVLEADGVACCEAVSGEEALEVLARSRYDLLLTDVHLPGMSGLDLLTRVCQHPPSDHLKVIMISGHAGPDEMAQMLLAGADDYLTKPFSVIQLQGRVKAALRLKAAQDRSAMLAQHLLEVNAGLERSLTARDADLVHARNALVLALAKLVGHRDTETGGHLMRLQRYCRLLAEEAGRAPPFSEEIDVHFVDMLECCAPLHDIGKLGLPDHILLKPGKLTQEERLLMQTHTVMGADTLRDVARQHGFALAFLHMAIDITRHHHERWDGTGYPDRLSGSDIPLAARIVAIADVYDALRSRRVYKPALSHEATVPMVLEASPGQFDPALLEVFRACAHRFDTIYRELAD